MVLVYLRFKVDSLINVPVPVTVVVLVRSIAAREAATTYESSIRNSTAPKMIVPSPPKVAPDSLMIVPPLTLKVLPEPIFSIKPPLISVV